MAGRHRVVIVGGGFGGLRAARALKSAPVDVTLIDRRNYHLFQPTPRDAALRLGFLTAEQFDAWVRPEDMVHPLTSRR
jgi:NADH dehydrogenase FAD-containing subunit